MIKAPNESHAADIIMSCFPKSKFIFLIRDGRDVVDSRQGKFHNPRVGMGPETLQERKYRIRYFSFMWNIHTTITKKAFEMHDPSLRLLVKYKDLRNNPITEIQRIYKFLEYEQPEYEIQKIAEETKFENLSSNERGLEKNNRKAQPGSWKENFNDDEKKIMNHIMGDNLRQFGYEVD